MPVMRHLNVGGTTYDTVGEASVTQVLGSGTKIATVSIDGTATDIYAPEGGSSVDPATAAPSMDGTAAVGSSVKYAREDHVHPHDTSRLSGVTLDTSADTYVVPVTNGVATVKVGDGLKVDDSGNKVTVSVKTGTTSTTVAVGNHTHSGYQATLVSGTNIKTINNESILGSGNIAVSGGTTTWYGTCNTSQTTSAKEVTCEGFELATGAIIGVLFNIGNTAAIPTLNVNSTGAKSIYIGSSAPSSTYNTLKWSDGTMCYFMYDGSYYRFMGSFVGGSQQQPRGAGTWFGSGSGAATSRDKTATISNFFLTQGALVTLEFANANTYTDSYLRLNVSNTGSYAIYYRRAATSSTNTLTWDANTTITFMYYAMGWYVISILPTQSGLPTVTSSDNGKVLQVVNGAWAAASLPSASGVSF